MRRRIHFWQDDGMVTEADWISDEAEYAEYPVIDNDEVWDAYHATVRHMEAARTMLRNAAQYGVPLNDDERAEVAKRAAQQAVWDAEWAEREKDKQP